MSAITLGSDATPVPRGWRVLPLAAPVVHPWFFDSIVETFALEGDGPRLLRDSNALFVRVRRVPAPAPLEIGEWTLWDERCEDSATRFDDRFCTSTGAAAVADELLARGAGGRFELAAVIRRALPFPPARLRSPDLDRGYDGIRKENRALESLRRQRAPEIMVRNRQAWLQRYVDHLFINDVSRFATPGTAFDFDADVSRPLESWTSIVLRRHPDWPVPFMRLETDASSAEDELALRALGFEIG